MRADVGRSAPTGADPIRCRKSWHPDFTQRNEQRIPKEQIQMLITRHPLKRLGTPEDVARAALYLASDNGAWITGIVLAVAGGAVVL